MLPSFSGDGMNFKGLHLSSGKKKKRENFCLVFTFYIKYGIREFHDFRRAKTAKKWAKKVCCTCRVVVY